MTLNPAHAEATPTDAGGPSVDTVATGAAEGTGGAGAASHARAFPSALTDPYFLPRNARAIPRARLIWSAARHWRITAQRASGVSSGPVTREAVLYWGLEAQGASYTLVVIGPQEYPGFVYRGGDRGQATVSTYAVKSRKMPARLPPEIKRLVEEDLAKPPWYFDPR